MKLLFNINLAFFLLIGSKAYAFTDSQAITTIVGEAADQGYFGMLLVGEILRHRHTLRGCYGRFAPHVEHENQSTWMLASRAWHDSEYTNFTKGATGFGSTQDWLKKEFRRCKIVMLVYKGHVFFKEER